MHAPAFPALLALIIVNSVVKMSVSVISPGAAVVSASFPHASEWVYRGEGAANLVVAYGGEDARWQGTVLRIRKKKYGTPAAGLPLDAPVGENACERSREFLLREVVQRIGSEFVLPGAIVDVDRTFLEDIQTACLPMRPEDRVQVSGIDTKAGAAWLLPDLCSPNALSGEDQRTCFLSVEIKPKSSVLPDAAQVSHAVKSEVSRFVMMQISKVKAGKAERASSYDPLDLFSGESARMQRAVYGLLREPQNNLAIRGWAGGCGSGAHGAVGAVQMENVTSDFERRRVLIATVIGVSGADAENALVRLLVQMLEESGVLQRLAALQRVSQLDIEHVYAMEQHLQDGARVPEHAARAAAPGRLPERVEDWGRSVDDWLVAQSAKDCSIIFTIAPRPPRDGQAGGSPGSRAQSSAAGLPPVRQLRDRETRRDFAYQLAMVDLDEKARHKIPFYYRQDLDIVAMFLSQRANDASESRVAAVDSGVQPSDRI